MKPHAFVTKRTIHDFEYLAPATIEEAVKLLDKYSPNVAILAGGTDMVPAMKARLVTPKYIVGLKKLSGLSYIKEVDGELRIGAMTKISQLERSPVIKSRWYPIYEALNKAFHSQQVRNMATIGGNICRSSPAGDLIAPLMALDAKVRLVMVSGERTAPLDNFFVGPWRNILDKEILTEIIVPVSEEPWGAAFENILRTSVDISKVNCAVKVTLSKDDNKCKDIRIVLGAVAPVPVRARNVEQAIRGKVLTDDTIVDATEKIGLDISPMTDTRSTAEYRQHVSKVLVKRLTREAIKRARSRAQM